MMEKTRRLDRLAVIGGLIAFVVLAFIIYLMVTSNNLEGDWEDTARERLLQRMPDNDVRADLRILTDRNWGERDDLMVKPLEQAVKKFPNSARLQLRLGSIAKGTSAVEPLRKAAELDPDNALPLYLLASEAASRKSWDEALILLKQGNQRKAVTAYPLPYEGIDIRGFCDGALAFPPHLAGLSHANISLRNMTKSIVEHVEGLAVSGDVDNALSTLSEVKLMGRKITYGKPHNMIKMLVGIAVTQIALGQERKIYTKTNSQSCLARVEKEVRDMRYTRAGARAFGDRLNKACIMRMIMRMFAVTLPFFAIPYLSLFVLMEISFWLWFRRRTRGIPASDIHLQATSEAFTTGKLLRLYVLAFIPVTVIAFCILYFVSSAHDFFVIVAGIAMIATAASPFFSLVIWTDTLYRRAYRQAGGELPKRRKGASPEDKREILRRTAGVHGGAMIFLVVWALVASVGLKYAVGVYPWQYGRMMLEPLKQEERYTTDLLNGKIKVPQKYILAVEKDEMRKDKK